MSDRNGQATALNIFTPIRPGEEEALHAFLAALPRGAGSPLARSTRTHFARWVIIDRLPTECIKKPDRLRRNQLLFTSSFDGDKRTYLEDLMDVLTEQIPEIWGRCEGCPAGPAELVGWLLDHSVKSSFFVAAYNQSTVHDVRNALAAREQTLAFALRAQDMDAEQRLRAFREAFA
ncbi:MAG: hypothetical protein Q8K79_12245 [Solirubrobacteraceae bacterium]|nr:hypothetical protein [Solirubrobacteraceae bacterium]